MPPKISKTEAELKKLTKIDGNKTCADCPEKVLNKILMYSYIALTLIFLHFLDAILR